MPYNENITVSEMTSYAPTLDINKIQSVEDCKKILNFMWKTIYKPISCDLMYNGIKEVEEYLK